MLSLKWHNELRGKGRPNTHNFKLIGLSAFKFAEKRNEIVQFAGLLFQFFYLFIYLVEGKV